MKIKDFKPKNYMSHNNFPKNKKKDSNHITGIPKSEHIMPAIKGEDDFYSWGLYYWVEKYEKTDPEYLRVWRGRSLFKGSLFIGVKHGDFKFYGTNISSMVPISNSHGPMWFDSSYDVEYWEDITQEFWEKYLKIGICSIYDFGHLWKFNEEGNIRTCNYCGKSQEMVIICTPKIKWKDLNNG